MKEISCWLTFSYIVGFLSGFACASIIAGINRSFSIKEEQEDIDPKFYMDINKKEEE